LVWLVAMRTVSSSYSAYFVQLIILTPNSVSTWSKAWVCRRSLAGIVGSNAAGGMVVCCECCVLSGRVICDELIPRPEESYLVRCV
jgi:hypothetical protein